MLGALRDAAAGYKRRLGQWLLRSPLHPLYVGLTGHPGIREYRRFVDAWQRAQPAPESLARHIATWSYCPRIGLLMAVRNSNPDWLEQAVRSVTAQIYPDWELCICDDASERSPDLARLAAADARIRYCTASTRLGISGALNQALAISTGEYIGVLDHDDFLSPEALYRVVEALQQEKYDVLYTDEEYVDESGAPVRPNLKPQWSPELLSNCMYAGHLVVAARALLDSAGSFRGEFDGAQDYDLALRVTEKAVRVAHVPFILYHWRQHGESIAHASQAKPWANEAGRRAAEDTIRRRGWHATVVDAAMPTRYHILRSVANAGRASIILTPREAAGLERRISALRASATYSDFEIVVACAGGAPIAGSRMVACSAASNYSERKNLAAGEAAGEYLVFLDERVRPARRDWLDRLIAQAQRPDVGAAGAKLLYRDGSLRHSGLALGMPAGVFRPGRRLFQSDTWRWLDYTRNVTAVSSECLAMRKEVLRQCGGFDPQLAGDFADADLCLRIHAAGYQVILEILAELKLEGGGASSPEHRAQFLQKWAARLAAPDPYYSAYLRTDREDTALRFPSEKS